MTRFLSLALALVLTLGIPVTVLAQQSSPGAPVTQTGSTGLAATTCLSSIGTSSIALTLTIPAPGGANSVYIDTLMLGFATTATLTPTGSVTTFTSTNIAGTPQFPVQQSSAAGSVNFAAGANGALAIPIKAQSGLGPTFVGPTANTNAFDALTACWHIAP